MNNQRSEKNVLLGILFMLINATALSVIYGVSKILTQEISSNLVVFLYKFSILIIITPWCFKNGLAPMKTKRPLLHLSRGFLSVSGALSLYYAIKHIELADITAIGYLEQVVLVVVGIWYFKEEATLAKIIGIIMSFLGALIVVNPKLIESGHVSLLQNVNPYYVFVMMSIAFWATNCTVVKVLGKTESTKVQLFYVLLVSSIISFPMAFMDWHKLGSIGVIDIKYPAQFKEISELGLKLSHIKYLAILALCYFTHSVSFFQALRHADLSTVVPFDYTRLLFAGIVGFLLFGEVPETGAYAGYALIVISGIYLIKSENSRRKKLNDKKIMELESEYEHI